jgi:NAD(P)-dependent dehydrogenase (short-subunit alcohol dehydrogenase family)
MIVVSEFNPEQFDVRFVDKVAVVTGGAKGIGRACALRFAREGAKVAVLDILAGEAAAAARDIQALGTGALALDCDVRIETQLAAAVDEVMTAWGRIDVWVNNAGIYTGSPLVDVPLKDWNDTVGTNFTGVFLGCRAVAPVMREQRSGRIINVSSMAGKTSWPATAEYSASKSAVIGLTRSVALDMAPFGVTVNAVCPGNTDTDMVRQVAATIAPRDGMTAGEWLAVRATDCPLQRLATPEEIAGPIAFLASDEARYVTGQAINIDGGMVL